MMQRIYLGHRITFNWPLLIFMAWGSLIIYSMVHDKLSCEDPVITMPSEENFQ